MLGGMKPSRLGPHFNGHQNLLIVQVWELMVWELNMVQGFTVPGFYLLLMVQGFTVPGFYLLLIVLPGSRRCTTTPWMYVYLH